jgi:hypothetical protein
MFLDLRGDFCRAALGNWRGGGYFFFYSTTAARSRDVELRGGARAGGGGWLGWLVGLNIIMARTPASPLMPKAPKAKIKCEFAPRGGTIALYVVAKGKMGRNGSFRFRPAQSQVQEFNATPPPNKGGKSSRMLPPKRAREGKTILRGGAGGDEAESGAPPPRIRAMSYPQQQQRPARQRS